MAIKFYWPTGCSSMFEYINELNKHGTWIYESGQKIQTKRLTYEMNLVNKFNEDDDN